MIRKILFLGTCFAAGVGAPLLLDGGCGGEVDVPDPSATPAAPAATVAEPEATPGPVLPELVLQAPARQGKSPAALGEDPTLVQIRDLLRDKVVMPHARDPDNPWAVSHGLIALGPDIALTNGAPAVDHLVATYAEVVEVGGQPALRFPEGRGSIRIEPHSDLILKALTEVGVPPDREVTVGERRFTVADLYRGSLADAWVDGSRTGFASWNDTPWALQGLAAWAPEDLAWTADGGHAMTMDGLTSAVVGKLAEETAFMQTTMKADVGFQKRNQGIFAYTCGGAHLLQGAAYAVARGFGTEADRAVIEAQIPLMFYRYPIEMAQVDKALQLNPDHRLVLVVQRLKFAGHFVESMHKLAALGFYEPTPEQAEVLKKATADLLVTVAQLEQWKVLDNLEQIRAQDEQVYLDIVGDAAHAMRGIELAMGSATVAW